MPPQPPPSALASDDRARLEAIVKDNPCPYCGGLALVDGPMAVWSGSDMAWLACAEGHTWTVAQSSRLRDTASLKIDR